MNGNGPILMLLMLLVYKGVITLDEAENSQYAMQRVAKELDVSHSYGFFNVEQVLDVEFLELFSKYMKEEN